MASIRSRAVARLPVLAWLRDYDRGQFARDAFAGTLAAILLIPQSMAYAILAGLPTEVGLYASIVPPVVYALFGTSRTLAVGPISLSALLVADALARSGAPAGSAAYLADALLLAALSGGLLLLMALLRADLLVNLISHPALSGFTSGAAVLIILSQLSNLTGLPVPSTGSAVALLAAAARELEALHWPTTLLGIGGIIFVLLSRQPLIRLLRQLGFAAAVAYQVSRAGPLGMIVLFTLLVTLFNLPREGVAVVGEVPAGLPGFTWPFFDIQRAFALLPAAAIISVIGYVGSVSVAKTLAHRRRQKVDNNQELVALGAANLAAAFTAGMPVAGGFSRSMVNYAAGACTQLAAVVAAALVAVVAVYFTPLFHNLPRAALAAIILVAVVPLLDWRAFVTTWHYDRADGMTLMATFIGVILFDLETGLLMGLALGVGVYIWRSSHPHVAVVGRLPGTQHFRNVQRYQTRTWPQLLLLRIDRSLFFANVSYVEELVAERAAEQPELRHLVLICSAVNSIDASALDRLGQLVEDFRRAGILVHLAEVKGPVMDRLRRSDFLQNLAPGEVFLSTEDAVETLAESAGTPTFDANHRPAGK